MDGEHVQVLSSGPNSSMAMLQSIPDTKKTVLEQSLFRYQFQT